MPCDPTVLQFVDAIVGAVICLSAVDHIRRMNKKTREVIRWAFILLAVGGFVLILGPMYRDESPNVEDLVAHVGLAALLLTDRRRPTDCPHVDECEWIQRREL